MKGSHKKLILSFIAHPAYNVPPCINSTKVLGENGYKVILIGYAREGIPRWESVGKDAYIFRIQLKSRKVKIAPLRKIFAVIEFLYVSLKLVRKMKPFSVITFNDPASLLLWLLRKKREALKINWLLEYPEPETQSLPETILARFTTFSWKFSDVLITPTVERLALTLARQPKCLNQKHFIVQNAPLLESKKEITNISGRTEEAIAALQAFKEKGCINIIYSGAVGDRYAVDGIIRAVGKFNGEFSLLILGPKHDLSITEVNRAMSYGKKDFIYWVDAVPYRETSIIYTYADIGFGTYRGDTLNTYFAAPGKLYEYLKGGLILLTDDKACLYADIKNRECAQFFPKNASENEIYESLQNLLLKKETIGEMKTNSIRLFSDSLNFNKQINSLIKCLYDHKI